MKTHVAKFAAKGHDSLKEALNAHIADGTSFLCADKDYEQKPGDGGYHLLTNGIRLIHNHAHYILECEDEKKLMGFVGQLKPHIQSLTFLVMDTEAQKPDGLIGAAPQRRY